jgi:phenylalanyl-tRNA synthetase beta chain
LRSWSAHGEGRRHRPRRPERRQKVISNVVVFDVYEGKGIEPGKKSIAIAVTIQPREKTLTDAEIDALSGKIVAEVTQRRGGVLRG